MVLLLLAALAFAEPSRGFTLNAEVLGRYGYTLDQYNAMDRSAQNRLLDWLMAMEAQREADLLRRQQQQVKPELKLDAEEIEGLARLSPGAIFDKTLPGGGANTPISGAGWSNSLRLSNGRLSRFTARNEPHDFELTMGDLGQSGSSMIGHSPYLSLKKGSSGSGSRFDYGYKLQTGVVDMSARLYGPDSSPYDARIDQAAAVLGGEDEAWAKKNLSYSTSWQNQQIFVGSALGHVGRAYNLFGPVDLAWSAMGLARVSGGFPNVTLDQSAGLRWRAAPDHNVGLFGGLTEAVSLFSKSVVADSIADGSVPADPALDLAPHGHLAAWGKMPYFSSMRYTVEAGRQWNPWTTVQSAAASVSDGKFGIHGAYSSETGDSAEFNRTRAQLGVSYKPAGGMDLWATAGRDDAALGNASISNKQILFGVTIRETVKEGPSSATLETAFTTGDQPGLPGADSNLFARQLQEELERILALKDLLEALSGSPGVSGRWGELQGRWRALDPETRRQLDELGHGWPGRVMAESPEDIDKALKLLELLGDVEVLDRIAVRAVRSQVMKGLEDLEVPLFGNKFQMKAPMIIAAAHAYSLGLRPLPGVTAADAKNSIEPFLTKELAAGLGCEGGDAQAVTDCLLGKLKPEDAEKLRALYGDGLNDTVQAAVGWSADVIRRELNSLILRIYMAADRLNELTVDGGARIGDLNARAMMSSFARLDQRKKRTLGAVYKLGRRRAETDTKAADAALTERLTGYGQARLAWLRRQPAWPAGAQVAVKPEHWAPLLAIYGDDRLFDVILKAKSLGPRVLIELNDDRMLGGQMVIKGDPTVIKLSPRPGKGPVVF